MLHRAAGASTPQIILWSPFLYKLGVGGILTREMGSIVCGLSWQQHIWKGMSSHRSVPPVDMSACSLGSRYDSLIQGPLFSLAMRTGSMCHSDFSSSFKTKHVYSQQRWRERMMNRQACKQNTCGFSIHPRLTGNKNGQHALVVWAKEGIETEFYWLFWARTTGGVVKEHQI